MENMKVGIDLVEVERFRTFTQESNFVVKVFTQEEIKDCFQKDHPYLSLAARFSAKEAIRKTIEENIRYNEMQISAEENGKLQVMFLDSVLNKKYSCQISITHTQQNAAAVCLTIYK